MTIAYKIKWRTGGETAERYSSKTLAQAILKSMNLTGSIVKVKLTNPRRTSAFTRTAFGGRVEKYPTGRRLVWMKIPTRIKGVSGYVYRTHVA